MYHTKGEMFFTRTYVKTQSLGSERFFWKKCLMLMLRLSKNTIQMVKILWSSFWF